VERADGDVGVATDGDKDAVADGGIKACEHVGVEVPVVVDEVEAAVVRGHARMRVPAPCCVGIVPERGNASHGRAVRCVQRHLEATMLARVSPQSSTQRLGSPRRSWYKTTNSPLKMGSLSPAYTAAPCSDSTASCSDSLKLSSSAAAWTFGAGMKGGGNTELEKAS
jgi:hypothetical protein